MNTKTLARIGILLLIVGIVGLVLFDLDSFSSSNLLVKVQSGSIVFLALLSVGLWFLNNSEKMVIFYKSELVGYIGIVLLIIAGINFVAVEYVSFMGGLGIFWIPIFMAALALGLFCANRAINTK
jgi:hypothetical protein